MTTDNPQINMADLFDDLAATLGIEEMPDQEKEELIAMMGETILQNSLARFVDGSDEETTTLINTKLEELEMPEFIAYVDEQYPDFGYIMNDETRLFLEELEEMETQG
jgi:hypothetical protein